MRKTTIFILSMILLICMFAGCNKSDTQTYIISFDSVGGTAVEKQTVKENEKALKPADPQKEGFTFVEWQLNNTTYNFDAPVTNDLTLTALYKINEVVETVLVVLDYQNEGQINNVTIAKGTSMAEPPKPEKTGYVFEGWFCQDKIFDFTTKIESNIVLVAKWKLDEKATSTTNNKKPSTDTNTKKPTDTSKPTDNSNDNSAVTTQNKNIKFSLVEGVWYAEGHDDVTLKFSIQDGVWVYLESYGFDYTTGTFEPNSGRGGTEYYYNNGEFYSEEVQLEGNSKLIFSKNNVKAVFYRQKNYPTEKKWPHETLLSEINGCYWYLDGYKYTYIKPTVTPWYDHEALMWESENIQIYDNKLIAFENYSYSEYSKISVKAESNTHNTLLVNPTTYADSLIRDYGMSVKGNKLTMTVGGKSYTFTKETKRRNVPITLTTSVESITKTVGESFEFEVKASPFWACPSISVTASNSSLLYPSSHNTASIDGNFTIEFSTVRVGDTQITIKDSSGKSSKTINLKVVAPSPISVSGVQLNKTNLELMKGNTETLIATVTPSNAANKSVSWTSSNNAVATVSSTGKITAKGAGSATIMVTTVDGNYTATCAVTVTAPSSPEPVSDVLIISNTQTISNQTIDTDVYITSTGVATFNNVTVNGNIYCYGQLKCSGCTANNVYAYAYGSMMSCGAFDGTHGKVSGGISCNNMTILDNALDYAFSKWGKK